MCCGPTATMTTSRACARKGMPSATVSAVSVLPFQATATVSPSAFQPSFGTINTGRPPTPLARGSARAVMAGRHRPDRDAMRIHELAKQPPCLIAPLVALALQGAVDLRGNREPHLATEHDRIFGGQAVQPDDVAVEAPGHQQGGLEDRARTAVADHRQEVLHRRLPAPGASITRLGCSRCAIIANPGDSGDRARLDGGGPPDYTPAPLTASNRQMNRSSRIFLALFVALCAGLALSRAAP